MKRIITKWITDLEPLAGSSEWYWGTDYASGDLHEAEDAFRSGHPIRKTGFFWCVAQRERYMSRYAQSRDSTWADRRTTMVKWYCCWWTSRKEKSISLPSTRRRERPNHWRCCLSPLQMTAAI